MKKFKLNNKTIVLASHNNGKIAEFKTLFSDYNVKIKTISSLGINEIDETGKTFEENALIKANEVSKKTGLLTIADDSGLEVDLLEGKPGVYSARYAGPDATDTENNNKLLMELEKFKDEIIKINKNGNIFLFNYSI